MAAFLRNSFKKKLVLEAYPYDLGAREVEAGGSGVQSCPLPQASLRLAWTACDPISSSCRRISFVFPTSFLVPEGLTAEATTVLIFIKHQ